MLWLHAMAACYDLHAKAACYGSVLQLHAMVACQGCMLWLHAVAAQCGCMLCFACCGCMLWLHNVAACYGLRAMVCMLWLHVVAACCGCILQLPNMDAGYLCLSELPCSIAWDTMLCYNVFLCGLSVASVISRHSVPSVNSSSDCPSSCLQSA